VSHTLLFDKNLVLKEAPDEGLESFYKDFLKNRSEELSILNEALQRLDYDTLRKLAHNWKGYSKPYGFDTLAQLAKKLEEASQKGEESNCENILKNISFYLEIKRKHLKQ
jgi:HPt (histidine-containing phosphotransfer) domain-containing protein